MSRTTSSRRTTAPGPKSVQTQLEKTKRVPHPQPALSAVEERVSLGGKDERRHHNLNTKRLGELAELAFSLKAAGLGLGVSKPYGDSERYDVIVDPRALCEQNSKACHPERSSPTSKARRTAQSKDPASAGSHQRRGREFPSAHPEVPSAGNDKPAPATLYRVQIKCSTQLFQDSYSANAHRRTSGRAVPYHPSEIDFIAAYVIPEDTWYIIPIKAIRGTSLMFRRKNDPKPGLYDQYREAWQLLSRP